MDSRLFDLTTQRPTAIRKDDLPRLAKALVALFRGKARATIGSAKNLNYIHIKGLEVDMQVLASDWAKIDPLLRDDAFAKARQASVPLHPTIALDVSGADAAYYRSVYHTLCLTFQSTP